MTLYLAYSIPFGIGTSFIFNAGLVIVSNYFSRRRSLALGFVSAGQGMGVLVQGPLLQTLIDNYGWKTTYRIMAGVVFGICLLGVTYDPSVKPCKEVENADQLTSNDEKLPHQREQERKRMFLDVSVWKVPVFVAITLSSAIAQFGHFVPQIHLVSSIRLDYTWSTTSYCLLAVVRDGPFFGGGGGGMGGRRVGQLFRLFWVRVIFFCPGLVHDFFFRL